MASSVFALPNRTFKPFTYCNFETTRLKWASQQK